MSFAIVAAVAAPLVIGGITKVINDNKAAAMQDDILAAQGVVNDLLDNREDVYDASGKIRDMKSMVKNPYENLGVATQAAEMQAAQTDQALANTLDTVQATGMGAGGATALAMAAAQSKKVLQLV